MPLDTAGKDACRYKLGAECAMRPSRSRPGEVSGAGRAGVLSCNKIVHAAPKTGLREAFENKQPCL
jgi:hypothetical protein